MTNCATFYATSISRCRPIFFYGDSDNTYNLEVAEIAQHHLGIDGFHPEPTPGRQTQMGRTAQMRRAWQQQINQLAKQPEHRGKTHRSLCALAATEPLGQGKDAETIRRWIARGELPAFKVGSQWRIDTDDLERFLWRQRRAAPGTDDQ